MRISIQPPSPDCGHGNVSVSHLSCTRGHEGPRQCLICPQRPVTAPHLSTKARDSATSVHGGLCQHLICPQRSVTVPHPSTEAHDSATSVHGGL